MLIWLNYHQIYKSAQSLKFLIYTHLMEMQSIDEQIEQLPKVQREVVEDVLDVKEVISRRSNQYRRFFLKWLGKPTSESTWIAEE
jgi:hypothetical protein